MYQLWKKVGMTGGGVEEWLLLWVLAFSLAVTLRSSTKAAARLPSWLEEKS